MSHPYRRSMLHALALALAASVAACGPAASTLPSVASAPAPSPSSSGAHSAHEITLLAAGDVLPHPEMWQQALDDGKGQYDFYPMIAGVAATVSDADLALCHLEPVLGTDSGPFEGFPTFNVPPQVLNAVKKVGFDGCSSASNHVLDHGEEGIDRTIDALDKAGLGHTGTFKTAADANTVKMYTVKGVKIAHLSYSKYFNGIKRPAGKEWIANQIDVPQILKAARKARQAGAQIVVLSLHWGTEYQHEPDADQQAWARAIISSPDIDVILGHHAHVVQAVEKQNGKWIIYGMGNQIARHAEPIADNREGVMMRLRFAQATTTGKWRVAGIEAIPIWVDLNPSIRLIELPKALADPATPPGKRAIYQAALDRIRTHLDSRDAIAAGLVVVGAKP